jgi:period circadian protein
LSHVDAAAIPYLGYLPQDLIGNSIFEYYHPEDLSFLKKDFETGQITI